MNLAATTWTAPHAIPNISLHYHFDSSIDDGCVITPELAKLLQLPIVEDEDPLGLYILSEPVNLIVKYNRRGEENKLSRFISKIAIHPHRTGCRLWIEYMESMEELDELVSAWMHFEGPPIVIHEKIPFNLKIFKANGKLFSPFFGPKSSMNRACRLINTRFQKFPALTDEEAQIILAEMIRERECMEEDDDFSTSFAISAWIILGERMGMSLESCMLTPQRIADYLGCVIKSKNYDTFIALLSNQTIFESLTEDHRKSLAVHAENILGNSGHNLAPFLVDKVLKDVSNEKLRIIVLKALKCCMQNIFRFQEDPRPTFYLMEKYAMLAENKLVSEDTPFIAEVLRSIYSLPMCQCDGGFWENNVFSATYLFLRRNWQFLFEKGPAFIPDLVQNSYSSLVRRRFYQKMHPLPYHQPKLHNFWILELNGFEAILLGAHPGNSLQMEAFDNIFRISSSPATILLDVIEYWLHLTNYIGSGSKMTASVTSWIMSLVDHVYSRHSPNVLSEENVKMACFMAHYNHHRMLALHLERLDNDANCLSYNSVITDKVIFGGILARNDLPCFIHLVEKYKYSRKELEDMMDIDDALKSLGFKVMVEVYLSFETTKVTKCDDDESLLVEWNVPNILLENYDKHQIVTASLQFVLLHFASLPIQASMIVSDLEGDEEIHPAEFEAFLNFMVDRSRALNPSATKNVRFSITNANELL